MVGGYLTFAGIEGKARWAGTPVEAALPVTMQTQRRSRRGPRGCRAGGAPAGPSHRGRLPAEWPALLGYNRVAAKAGADVVVAVGDDPLIVAGAYGRGRGVAFTSDCGPHWCPPPFVDWAGYAPMWQQLVRLGRRLSHPDARRRRRGPRCHETVTSALRDVSFDTGSSRTPLG